MTTIASAGCGTQRRRRWQPVGSALLVLAAVLQLCSVLGDSTQLGPTQNMSHKERNELKEEAREMFYHAYRAYMDNAYPADELMPLSCAGRFRGVTPSRGDMDDVLGNFTMTLVDTLDTLVLLGDFEEFAHASRLVIDTVQFDSDIVVSVFETNIRMVGGLLSAHILAEYLQKEQIDCMRWYRGEMLEMAKDLGYRLLPAFNTTTGIPHARVNLRTGMKDLQHSRETCTACAGTILLEFAALSRLSGEPIFEAKAHRAMDSLWQFRNRGSDLMGTVLNVHSGDWVRRDSGVGAGIDSYYEYCLKSYVLLGEHKYLSRFQRHYEAIMKYISQGPLLMDVHMHRPHAKSRNFMDALLAFWPGLQVLSGDLKPAVQTHEMLYQVMQMHTFLPEAFTFDFQIHWGQHHLRPEFIESTYFLYKATGDHYYLQAAKKVLQALQKHARVPCGFAAVNDLRTGKHEDRMDSFVLSETLKYLFLIFADPSELILDLDNFVFTTEAHLLPLSLGQLTNATSAATRSKRASRSATAGRKRKASSAAAAAAAAADAAEFEDIPSIDFMRTCPSPNKLFPETVRRPLRDLVSGTCPRVQNAKRLKASEFEPTNAEHLRTVQDMGITVVILPEGKVQLLHSFYNAKTPLDAERGLLFMQEMLELTKEPPAVLNIPTEVQAVFFRKADMSSYEILVAGPSHFSPELRNEETLRNKLAYAKPFTLCSALENPTEVVMRILVVQRGDCTFVDKARRAQAAGAWAVIVVDNQPDSSSKDAPMFAMSGDGKEDVSIPVVFLYNLEADILRAAFEENADLEVTLMQMAALKRRITELQSAVQKAN